MPRTTRRDIRLLRVPTIPTRFRPKPRSSPTTLRRRFWLLVLRGGFAKPELFICPSTSDLADAPYDRWHRSNFRSSDNLSYSYCSPFTSAPKFYLADWLPYDFAVMADKNPGKGADGDVTAPAWNAPPLEMAKANSRNHNGGGQNVLYPAGNVTFQRVPYCGKDGDNIYTVQARRPTTAPVNPTVNGFCDPTLSPAAAEKDSFLVPTAQDH